MTYFTGRTLILTTRNVKILNKLQKTVCQFAPGFAPTTYNSCKSGSFTDNCTTDGQAGVDPETVDVSPVEVNEKEPLSITDNGSGKSGRLAIPLS